MYFDPAKLHRRSIRLQDYDYSQAGAYYVTMVIQHRVCMFGEVVDGKVRLNPSGGMIEKWWHELENKCPHVVLGNYVVMPNHFHGIVNLVGVDLRVDPYHPVDPSPRIAHSSGGHTGPPLPTIIQWFKTMTINEYIHGVKQMNWPPFDGKLWQRNYYEHIIRNEKDYERIHLYIQANPANWMNDEENPEQSQ